MTANQAKKFLESIGYEGVEHDGNDATFHYFYSTDAEIRVDRCPNEDENYDINERDHGAEDWDYVEDVPCNWVRSLTA